MFKEISRRKDVTITTLVEFTFDDGSTKEIEVPHFFSNDAKIDEDYIQKGLQNRFISESRALGLVK